MFVVSLALASPDFSGDEGLVSMAHTLWPAVTECAGGETRAASSIYLASLPPETPTPDRPLGHATLGRAGFAVGNSEGGLVLVVVSSALEGEERRSVLAHELAHAWRMSGPHTMVEGSATFLAACVTGRSAFLPSMDHFGGLREFDRSTVAATEASYEAAGHFMLLANTAVPSMIADDSINDWAALLGVLRERGGSFGREVADLVDAPLARQRQALEDLDRDGRPSLLETFSGTSDSSWDTDGDGWRDGVAPREGWTPIGIKTVSCVGEGDFVEGSTEHLLGMAPGGWWQAEVRSQNSRPLLIVDNRHPDPTYAWIEHRATEPLRGTEDHCRFDGQLTLVQSPKSDVDLDVLWNKTKGLRLTGPRTILILGASRDGQMKLGFGESAYGISIATIEALGRNPVKIARVISEMQEP